MADRELMLSVIDAIAREWDGCEFEDAMVPDIGQAIRQAGLPRVNALFAATPNEKASMGEAELPEPVAHVHSNGDFCADQQIKSRDWPVYLYTEEQVRALLSRHKGTTT